MKRCKNDWKRNEQEDAKMLGCKRNARSMQALSGGTLADSANEWLTVESKLRDKLPDFLKDALAQAQRAARADQLPIAVFHERGTRRRDSLVVMTLGDFVDNFVGNADPGEASEDGAK